MTLFCPPLFKKKKHATHLPVFKGPFHLPFPLENTTSNIKKKMSKTFL